VSNEVITAATSKCQVEVSNLARYAVILHLRNAVHEFEDQLKAYRVHEAFLGDWKSEEWRRLTKNLMVVADETTRSEMIEEREVLLEETSTISLSPIGVRDAADLIEKKLRETEPTEEQRKRGKQDTRWPGRMQMACRDLYETLRGMLKEIEK